MALATVGRHIVEKARLPRWCCANCGLFYGTSGKVKYGYCSLCFETWLAECRLGVLREQRTWADQRARRLMSYGEVSR